MTWIYSSFAWRGNWSAEPQTVAVPCAVWQCVALLGRPLELQVLSSSPQGLLLYPHLPPRVCCFLFQKVTKINLQVSFFVT